MATTQQQPGAWGGRRYGSFAGRVQATVVSGPWCVEARDVFTAGALARGTKQAGAIARQTYTAGAVARQGACE